MAHCCTALLIASGIVSLLQEAGQDVPGQETSFRETRNDTGIERQGAYIEFYIPEPLSQHEFRKLLHDLDRSDAGAQLLESIFDEYRIAYESIRTSDIRSLWDFSSAMGTARPTLTTTESSALFESLMDMSADISARMWEIERQCSKAMRETLPADDLGILDQYMARRERAHCNTVPAEVPGGDIDLVLLLERVQITAETLALLAPFLQQYEIEATAMFRRKHERRLERMVRSQYIAAELSAPVSDIASGAAGAFDGNGLVAERRRTHRSFVVAERRILELNERCLSHFESVAPGAEIAKVRELFNTMVYRPVYPDPWDADRVLTTATGISDLTDAQRAALIEILNGYRGEHELYCRRMKRVHIDWRYDLADDLSMDGQKEADLRQTLIELRDLRSRLGDKTVTKALDVLNDLQAVQVGSALAERQQAIDLSAKFIYPSAY